MDSQRNVQTAVGNKIIVMKKFVLVITFLIFSRLVYSQLDSIHYRIFLKEILKVDSMAKFASTDSLFDSDKFIKYAKENVTIFDSIKYSDNIGGWYGIKYKDGKFLYANRIGIYTYPENRKEYYRICFYDYYGFIKGPEWSLATENTFFHKRFWNQTKYSKFSRPGKIKEKNYLEERYRFNGSLKLRREYFDNHKVNTWIYYDRKGNIRKVKNFKPSQNKSN